MEENIKLVFIIHTIFRYLVDTNTLYATLTLHDLSQCYLGYR